jgi:valacyclovir hydrolase
MQTVHIHEQAIFYETHGSGDPLVLIHGFAQVGRDLGLLARALATRYSVILPDVPGYGRSTPPTRSFPQDFYMRDAQLIGAWLAAIQVERAHILGFSDGGEIALLMPILFPALCRSVVAWGAVGSFSTDLCDTARKLFIPAMITDDIRAHHPGQPVESWPAQWAKTFCAIAKAGGDISLRRAGEITCPLLLINGDDDTMNPVRDGERFIQAVGSAKKQFTVFENTGHALHLEQPSRFLSLVRSFLNNA